MAKKNLSGIGFKVSGDEIDQRRLAGAVGSDQGDELALIDNDVDTVDGAAFAEMLGQIFGLKEDHLSLAAKSSSVPTMPVGKAMTRKMRTAPNNNCQYSVQATAYVFR